MEILRKFAKQNKRVVPEGARLRGGAEGSARLEGSREQDLSHGEGSADPTSGEDLTPAEEVQGRYDVTVWQALRNRRLRNCFLALSFALCSLVLAYYGASFGLESFAGEDFSIPESQA